MVRPALQRELLLGLVADDRDGPQPKRPPELDSGSTNTAGRTMHQQRLTCSGLSTPDQREQARQVVEGCRRAGFEAHVLR